MSVLLLHVFTSFQSRNTDKVFQIHVTNWSPDGWCPNLISITDAIDEMTKTQCRTGNHPVLVHCRLIGGIHYHEILLMMIH